MLTRDAQIAAFIVSAAACGAMLLMWCRLSKEHKEKLWQLYGWFNGLGCAGSCFGIAAAAANMQYETLSLEDRDLLRALNSNHSSTSYNAAMAQMNENREQMFLMTSVLVLPDAIQVFFITVSNLMVLQMVIFM